MVTARSLRISKVANMALEVGTADLTIIYSYTLVDGLTLSDALLNHDSEVLSEETVNFTAHIH